MGRELSFGKKLRSLFWKPSPADEVAEELSHHFELMVREGIDRGLSRADAETEARARFGSTAEVSSDCEQVARTRNRRLTWRDRADRIGADLRWAIRAIRGAPVEAGASVLTLGIVIAANALIFGVVFAVALKALPYRDADRLVVLKEVTAAGDRWELSQPNLESWRAGSKSLTSISGWLRNEVTLRSESTPRLRMSMVTEDFFPMLAVSAVRGRSLVAADQASAGSAAAVLSYHTWRDQFGADPEIVGRTITLDADQYQVVGVMPGTFRLPNAETDIWVPLGPAPLWMRNRAVHVVDAIGRLAPGQTIATATAELAALASQVETSFPGEDPKHRPELRSLREAVVGDSGTTLLLLETGVVAILLIAIVNLTGLALTRAVARDGELALRAALGASRSAVARQLTIESGLIGLAGGLTGLVLALVAVGPMVAFLPPAIPRPSEIGIDWRIGLATVCLGLVAGLTIGGLTAFRASRSDPSSRLLAGSSRMTGSDRQLRIERLLVSAQLGGTVVLVAIAGLLVRSLLAAGEIEPGFQTEGLASATVSLAADEFDQTRLVDWYRDLPARLESVPGVLAATATSAPPISGGDPTGQITVEGLAFPPGDEPGASFRRVLPNYFSVMRIPLIRGREFTALDRGLDPLVIIVSEAMADRLWPGADPIGKRIKIGPPERQPWLTVVGVVGNVRNLGLDAAPAFDTYEPHAQRSRATMTVIIRTDRQPELLLPTLRAQIGQGNRSVLVWDVRTMTDRIARSLAPRRFPAQTMIGFGGIGLLLAVVGVYGVTAQSVKRRRRELAIRIALGARPEAVERMVVGQSLRAAVVGILIGVPVALAATRALGGLLFGVRSGDPITFAVTSLVLIGATAAAAWLPGRRASRADPLEVIRDSR